MSETARVCEWCKSAEKMRGKRPHAVTCSKECRQQRARFRVAPAESVALAGKPSRGSARDTSRKRRAAIAADPRDASDLSGRAAAGGFDVSRLPGAEPLVFAYADPPYPGCAERYYDKPEIDHHALVSAMCAHSNGWALSTSASALPEVLRVCPPGVRVVSWFRRPFHGVSWEPVILWGGRKVSLSAALPDALIEQSRLRKYPGALVGMKPPAFCEWVFRLLGARAGDQLVDVFPGSGAVTRAWELFTGQRVQRSVKPSRLELAIRRVLPAEVSRRTSRARATDRSA